MSDEVLGALLGSEEGAVAESGGARLSGAAMAASLAASHAHASPEAAQAATDFLRDQSRLLREQAEELREERALRLSLMRGQRANLRLRLVLQILVATAALLAASAALFMVWNAVASRAVVVEAFETPPALAGTGIDGRVVAAAMLDQLEDLQAATRATVTGLASVGAWASDIKLQVPETGVSIGEIDRLLHDRLSRDLHISGDLLRTPSGLKLTVRGDTVPGKSFAGPENGLDSLIRQAAEYVFGRSQPTRYAAYLAEANRNDDALAFLPGAFARATTDPERAVLADGWGNVLFNLNHPAEAVEKYQLAMSLAPRRSATWWLAWGNILATPGQQTEEATWQQSAAFLREAARGPAATRPELRRLAFAAAVVWDLPLYLAALRDDAKRSTGAGSFSISDGPNIADAYGLMHDHVQAARYLAASDPTDPFTVQEGRMLAGSQALEHGDAAAAVPPLQAFTKDWLADPAEQTGGPDLPCALGLALGLAHRMAEAEAVFARTGAWSRCAAFHGTVLARAGNEAAARRIWNAGLQAGPDLPWIYLHRGLFEAGSGARAEAAADFAAATAKAPHWADPWKAWGDLLAAQQRFPEAQAKYATALLYAPDWPELRMAAAQHRN